MKDQFSEIFLWSNLKIQVFNSFDKNVQFTLEEKSNEIIPFLDILICRKRNDIATAIFRKSTCNNISKLECIWASYVEKIDIKDSCRTDFICYLFNSSTFRERIKVFHEKSNYHEHIVKQILHKAFEEHSHKNAINTTLDD